jgi:tetratricopeptide (TPR) repeat protein
MKPCIACGIVLLLTSLAAPTLSQTETPTAILLTCNGEVSIITDNGERVNGAYGYPLFAGDEVRTGESGQAEIHFENGTWIQVGPKSTMQIKAAKKQDPDSNFNMGERSFQIVQNFLRLKDSEGTTSLAPLRSIEKDREIIAWSPCLTKVRDPRPSFHWKAKDTLQEMKITLYNEDGVLWTRNVRGEMSMPYPEDALPLEAGTTYSWTVETTDPLHFPPLRSKAAYFEILSPGEQQNLEDALEKIEGEKLPSPSTYRVIRASLFFTYSLMEEAIAETKTALTVEPENAILRSILARLYAEIGRTEDALSEYDQLIEQH